jgi:hypothetical protein
MCSRARKREAFLLYTRFHILTLRRRSAQTLPIPNYSSDLGREVSASIVGDGSHRGAEPSLHAFLGNKWSYRRWPGPGPFGGSELEHYITSISALPSGDICLLLRTPIILYPFIIAKLYVNISIVFKATGTHSSSFYTQKAKGGAGRTIVDYLSSEKKVLRSKLLCL